MNSAFQWISDLVRALASAIPRIGHCPATEYHIKFRRGKIVVVLPGMYVYWPITTEIKVLKSNEIPMQMASQGVTSSDGKSLQVGCSIVFRIRDPLTAVIRSSDIKKSIEETCQGIISEQISRTEFSSSIHSETEAMLKAMSEVLSKLGVRVISLRVTDFSRAFPVKVYQEWNHSDIVE